MGLDATANLPTATNLARIPPPAIADGDTWVLWNPDPVKEAKDGNHICWSYMPPPGLTLIQVLAWLGIDPQNIRSVVKVADWNPDQKWHLYDLSWYVI